MSDSKLRISIFESACSPPTNLGICLWEFDAMTNILRFDQSFTEILSLKSVANKSLNAWFEKSSSNLDALLKYLDAPHQEEYFDICFTNDSYNEVLRISAKQNHDIPSANGFGKLITKEILAEQELEEKSTGFDDVQAISKVGSWEWYPTTNEVRWSKEMFKIMGLDPKKDAASFEQIFKYTHPEDIKRLREISARAAELKKAIPIEYRVITPSGELKHVRGIGESILDENGNLVKLYGTIQDISDQKRLKNQLDAFWNNSQDLLCILSIEGKLKQVNPKFYETTGHAPSAAAGFCLIDVIHEDDKAAVAAILKELSQNKLTQEFNARAITKDGEEKSLSWSLSSSRIDGLIYASARDVSELVSAHQKLSTYSKELLHKNRELEQFAYVASHDLREPLRTITSFIELWLQDHESSLDENGQEVFAFVQTATKRMEKLINGLLNYSVIGENIEWEHVNVKTCVDNVCEDLQTKIKELDAEILYDKLPKIRASNTAIHQLFLNLIHNGLKYNKSDKPQIRISARCIDDLWQFSVKDNGIGIKPEDQEKIFKIFERLHNRDLFEGSGIGLAQVQKIINAHRGKIWVESELGKGSTFYFTLGKPEESDQTQKLKLVVN